MEILFIDYLAWKIHHAKTRRRKVLVMN